MLSRWPVRFVVGGLVVAGSTAILLRERRRRLLRRGREAMEADALQTLVLAGLVTETEARIWVRGREPVELELILEGDNRRERRRFRPRWDPAADRTTSFLLSEEAGLPLRPGTAYELTVHGVGRCRFHTAPADVGEERFAIAVASCHDPFRADGTLHDEAEDFLTGLADKLADCRARRMLWMGDQVYTDLPAGLSLFDPLFFEQVAPEGRASVLDCTRDEVRALIHARYRSYWKVGAWQRLQASLASSAICDDHEIADNFGSHPEHGTEKWQRYAAGAFDAFYDYQASRTFGARPAAFDHAWRYGPVTAIVLDLRSERVSDGTTTRVLSEAQLGRLRRHLEEAADQDVVLLGLSIPITHVPEWMTDAIECLTDEGSDFSDRWNRGPSLESRNALLDVLRAHQRRHPRQRLILVGGDVHVGAIGELRWAGEEDLPPILQLTTSPISNVQPPLVEFLARAIPAVQTELRTVTGEPLATVRLLDEVEGSNPYGELNLGLVEIDRSAGRTRVRLSLLGRDDGGIAAVTRTPWF